MQSDETGLIVVGKDSEGFGYVLEDLSGKYSPNHWAKIANDAAHEMERRLYSSGKESRW
jgi:phage terminase large subunit-like protein